MEAASSSSTSRRSGKVARNLFIKVRRAWPPPMQNVAFGWARAGGEFRGSQRKQLY